MIMGGAALGIQSGSPLRRQGFLRMRFYVAPVLVLLCLLATGCAGSSARPVTDAERQALEKAAAGSPQLQTGEKIRVTVYGEPSLSGDYQIDPSGFVSLPLAGTVKAAGLSQQQLEQDLATKFRSGYLKNPKITVSISEFRPFYIG